MYDKKLNFWAYNPSNLGSVVCACTLVCILKYENVICGINIKVRKH